MRTNCLEDVLRTKFDVSHQSVQAHCGSVVSLGVLARFVLV